MKLRLIILFLLISFPVQAGWVEEETRINYLLTEISRVDGVFIRNGAEHSSEEAVQHLGMKLKRAMSSHGSFLIKTGNQVWLTDPIFSERALLPARKTPPALTAKDINKNFPAVNKEALMAFEDLKARYFIPTQWGTFALGDEPPGYPGLDLKRTIEAKRLDSERFLILDIGQVLLVVSGSQ